MKRNDNRIDLICSENIFALASELLRARGYVVDEDAPVSLIENGRSCPLGKAVIIFEWTSFAEALDSLSEWVAPIAQHSLRTIIGKTKNDTLEVIAFSRICYFEARGNYTYCITAGGEYKVKDKLYTLEENLPKDRFVRVSRSYIVNIENVRQIVPWFGRRLILRFISLGKEVEVSRNYVASFKSFLGI